MKNLRLLWVSDPPETSSAYANQTALFLPRLRAAGYEVALLATNNAYMRRLPDGTPVLPVVSDRHGNTIVREHAKRFQADVVLTLIDPHVLAAEVYADLPWCAWAPLDFETPTRATIAVLKHAKWVWSPSMHGAKAYEKVGLKATWVPHGVDSQVFSPMDQIVARDFLGASIGAEIPLGAFLSVVVAANRGSPSRKGFYEMLSAWKIFSDRHLDAFLYLHTEVTGLGGIGEDLRAIADLVGLRQGSVLFPLQYEYVCGMLGPEHLVEVCNAADVYLSTSHGEGFGLGAYEAQLCGCPVILPQNTAQVEAGGTVKVTHYMPFDGATTWGRPDVDQVVELLEKVYLDRRRDVGVIRERALDYDVDRVFKQHFLPTLECVAEDLDK